MEKEMDSQEMIGILQFAMLGLESSAQSLKESVGPFAKAGAAEELLERMTLILLTLVATEVERLKDGE